MAGPGRVPPAAARLPRLPGVYRFRDRYGRPLYLGRAVDLRRRVSSYWGDLGDRGHLAAMVRNVHRVEAVVCDSGHEAAWLERNLLERELLPANRTPGGQEVPVYVCVRGAPGGWRLTVDHVPPDARRAVCFGPYLGGARVRTAVRALRQAHPDPELARVRGVEPADPDAPAAVLRRDPSAVAAFRATLLRRRDAAVDRLAFEVAARLQAELDAVDWVVAEQRATVRDPVDLDAYGWADGVLVRLGIRAGRMCEWDQTACVHAAAAARLSVTPPAWRPFADRTADLAARLAR
jgi:excinuclease ABC subunit C